MEEKKIIYIHIPKAGGRTLLAFFNQNYPDRVISDLHEKSYEELSGFSDDFIDKYSVFAGHFGLGLHKYIKNAKYITILRDPIDRIVSLYYYISENPNHPFYNVTKKQTFEEFIKNKQNIAIDNFQTRLLSASDIFDYRNPSIERSDLERVKEIIGNEKILSVTLDQISLFMVFLKIKFGLKQLGYSIRNITKSRPRLEEIPQYLKDYLVEKNQLDYELFDFVKGNFFKQLIENNNDINNELQILNISYNEFKIEKSKLDNKLNVLSLKNDELIKINRQLKIIELNNNNFEIRRIRLENKQLKDELALAKGWINYVQGLKTYKIFKYLKDTISGNNKNLNKFDNQPEIFHITHWKAGSQWIRSLFENIASNRVIKPGKQNSQFLFDNIVDGGIYVTLYLRKDEFDSVKLPENHRKFFVMRDLRDTLVSYYFSMKYSHGLINDYVGNLREKLTDTEIEDGFLLLIEPLQAMAEIQLSWINSDILIIKYEDIIENEIEQLMKIVEFCEINESKERILTAIKKSSFKSKSKGRNLGDVDIKSHTRQGLPGDWKNHFTPKMKELFKERFGEVLIMTGYEKNYDW
jgi:hypothetical protein